METSWERISNDPLLVLSLRKEKVTDLVDSGERQSENKHIQGRTDCLLVNATSCEI